MPWQRSRSLLKPSPQATRISLTRGSSSSPPSSRSPRSPLSPCVGVYLRRVSPPLRSSHINAKIQRDPSQVRGGELVGGSGHRFAPILLFNLDSDRFVVVRIMSRDGRDSLGPCRRILDTRFASLPTRRETENSRSNRSRRLSGN